METLGTDAMYAGLRWDHDCYAEEEVDIEGSGADSIPLPPVELNLGFASMDQPLPALGDSCQAVYLRVCIPNGNVDTLFRDNVLRAVFESRFPWNYGKPSVAVSLLVAREGGYPLFDPRHPPSARFPAKRNVVGNAFPVPVQFEDEIHAVIDVPLVHSLFRNVGYAVRTSDVHWSGSLRRMEGVKLFLGCHARSTVIKEVEFSNNLPIVSGSSYCVGKCVFSINELAPFSRPIASCTMFIESEKCIFECPHKILDAVIVNGDLVPFTSPVVDVYKAVLPMLPSSLELDFNTEVCPHRGRVSLVMYNVFA